jgi:hypothetical protein
LIISPGTQPISISFRKTSFFSNEWILARAPVLNSESLFIVITKVVLLGQSALRFSEMK